MVIDMPAWLAALGFILAAALVARAWDNSSRGDRS